MFSQSCSWFVSVVSRSAAIIALIVSFSSATSPLASTVIERVMSPCVTAVETSAIARSCVVSASASVFTLSVRPFQVPDTPSTVAWTPSRPSVPTSRATRVTSSANVESWSTIVLIVLLSSRISPRASTVIFCVRSPSATAVVTSAIARTWVVKFAASWLTLSVRPFQVRPNAFLNHVGIIAVGKLNELEGAACSNVGRVRSRMEKRHFTEVMIGFEFCQAQRLALAGGIRFWFQSTHDFALAFEHDPQIARCIALANDVIAGLETSHANDIGDLPELRFVQIVEQGNATQDIVANRCGHQNSSQNGGPAHAADAQHVGRGAQAHLSLLGQFPDALEASRQHVVELLPHAVQVPLVVLAVLHPFEIADRHAAGVGQNVGQHDDAALGRRCRRRRAGSARWRLR